jgi:cytochrome P450
MSPAPTLDGIALDDPRFYASQPYEAYRALREQAPVFRYEPGDFWALSKHADVVAVSRDPARFSSAHGVAIDERAHPERIDARELPHGEMLLTVDPPRHGALRKVLAHHFTHKALAPLQERIREIARANLDEAAEAGVADFADLVSIRTAIQAICIGLDLPREDWEMLKRLSATQTAGFDATDAADFQVAIDGFEAIRSYFEDALADRLAHPRGEDDWMTTLVQGRIDGEPLALDTQLLFCIDLLTAGNETTDPLLACGTFGLWQQPDERARLIADRSLLPNAVNELLRWVTPVVAMTRTAMEDVELRGTRIAKGDCLVLLYGSANRDEEAWGEDAERIDVGREGVARQLAFGTGIHVCLGAHLARLEAQVVFDELLTRYPGYEIAGEVERLPSTLVNAIRRLPIALRP